MAKTLAQKLFIKPDYRIRILNAPDDFEIEDLPDSVIFAADGETKLDMVYLYVNSIKDVEQYAPTAIDMLRYDGLLWIAFPKKSSGINTDINRDTGWETLDAAGLRPVTSISIDDTWSALRFRPKAEVK